jgi:hypothetical protein
MATEAITTMAPVDQSDVPYHVHQEMYALNSTSQGRNVGRKAGDRMTEVKITTRAMVGCKKSVSGMRMRGVGARWCHRRFRLIIARMSRRHWEKYAGCPELARRCKSISESAVKYHYKAKIAANKSTPCMLVWIRKRHLSLTAERLAYWSEGRVVPQPEKLRF